MLYSSPLVLSPFFLSSHILEVLSAFDLLMVVVVFIGDGGVFTCGLPDCTHPYVLVWGRRLFFTIFHLLPFFAITYLLDWGLLVVLNDLLDLLDSFLVSLMQSLAHVFC